MLWQIVGYAALGLLAAFAAARLFPARLPSPALLLGTGLVSGLTGGLVTYTILNGAHPGGSLAGALATAAAGLSVLARPPKRGRHVKAAPHGA